MSLVYALVWGTLIQQPQVTDAHGEQFIQNLDNLGLKGTSSSPAGGVLALIFLICCCWVAKSYPTLCDSMDCSTPGFIALYYLPEFAQIHVHWVSDLTILSSVIPFASCLQSFPASGSIPMSWLVASGGLRIEIQHQSFQWYSGLISFRIDWFDLLAVQRTLKSLLQHHSSKASVLQHSAFFTVQLSHSYMTTGKTITLTIWTFVSKTMSLLFSTLSRFVIAFLRRSKSLLISWLQLHPQWFWSPPK